ncbi:MAG: hypothetical protein HY443_02035 [Candidatus Nealsonbacteria bacterium]|nr:hypothetical protein [Candidatus Nealsonbacteria bacterium]
MNRRVKEVIGNLKGISLEESEKNQMRDSILLYVKERPIVKPAILRPSIFDYLFLNPLPRLAAAVLTVTLGFGTIATVAAEKSLPGELLHPVKIKINENVRSLFTFSPYAKAEWEVERANRRLMEVERLAEAGKLKTETIKEAEKRFEEHVQKASAVMAEAEEKEGKERGSEMRSTLGALFLVHRDVLGAMIEEKTEETKEENKSSLAETKLELRELRENVKEKLKVIVDDDLPREKEEKKVERKSEPAQGVRILEASLPSDAVSLVLPQSAAEGKFIAAENKIAEVQKFIDLKRDRVGQNALLEAENLLKLAREAVADGKTKIGSGDFNGAFVFFQKAIFQAQTSQRLMTIAQEVLPARNLRGFEGKIRMEERDGKEEIRIKIEIEDDRDEKTESDRGKDGQEESEIKGVQDERRQGKDGQDREDSNKGGDDGGKDDNSGRSRDDEEDNNRD